MMMPTFADGASCVELAHKRPPRGGGWVLVGHPIHSSVHTSNGSRNWFNLWLYATHTAGLSIFQLNEAP